MHLDQADNGWNPGSSLPGWKVNQPMEIQPRKYSSTHLGVTSPNGLFLAGLEGCYTWLPELTPVFKAIQDLTVERPFYYHIQHLLQYNYLICFLDIPLLFENVISWESSNMCKSRQ